MSWDLACWANSQSSHIYSLLLFVLLSFGGFLLLLLFLVSLLLFRCDSLRITVFFFSHVSPFLTEDGEFPGLIPLIECYLSNMDVDVDTHCTISQYLKLISRRASGEW